MPAPGEANRLGEVIMPVPDVGVVDPLNVWPGGKRSNDGRKGGDSEDLNDPLSDRNSSSASATRSSSFGCM